jgi:hypothetical protein
LALLAADDRFSFAVNMQTITAEDSWDLIVLGLLQISIF